MYQVVIIGGGIAGSALATTLARQGIEVLLLERTREHVDRVRGEWVAPWGVAELVRLALYQPLMEAGANHTRLHTPYGEDVAPETAQSMSIDLATIVPDIPGGLCIQHTVACNTLNRAAVEAGATFLREVSGVRISSASPAELTFFHAGGEKSIRCKLIVGADGRGSSIARQAATEFRKDPTNHFMSGLLVDGVPEWPSHVQTIGIEGDVVFYVFPQGKGRLRLYLCYSRQDVSRFAGSGGAAPFLEAFKLKSLPHSAAIAAGRPAGPCHGYPNEDVWADVPVALGVVLVGDAAGHNDPSIGQGMAITFRDVRLVAEAMSADDRWDLRTFQPYVAERRERMRRLRISARWHCEFRTAFCEEGRRKRERMAKNIAADPTLAMALMATLQGPHAMPAEAFADTTRERLFQ